MFKLFVLAALMAFAAAEPKPGYVASPVAYSAVAPAYSGYSAYSSPYAYSGYAASAYPSAYSAGYSSYPSAYSAGYPYAYSAGYNGYAGYASPYSYQY